LERFGQALAAVALLLQIALPARHSPVLSEGNGSASEFYAAFDEHALCLARDRGGDTEAPAKPPKPVHHEFAACCFWHGNAGLGLAPAATFDPVAFTTRSGAAFTPSGQAAPRRLTGALGARAPPLRA